MSGKLELQVVLRGQSKNTLKNHIQRIALFVVHFGKLPEQIEGDEINDYLVALARDPRSPSRCSFKHMVYGLRYYYQLLGLNKNSIALPSLKKDTKLPVILNQRELKELFAVPTLLKQRVVLTLIYSAGLRGQEVINMKISDIDFERKTILIRQSKYKKDRVVPLAESMAVGLRKYFKADYHDRAIKKPVSLDSIEFLRRFNMHILPQRLVKIRRYGIYNHTLKRNLELHFVKPDINAIIKQQKKPETTIERFQRITGINTYLCPVCKEGRMVTIRELPRICSPAWLPFDIMQSLS